MLASDGAEKEKEGAWVLGGVASNREDVSEVPRRVGSIPSTGSPMSRTTGRKMTNFEKNSQLNEM